MLYMEQGKPSGICHFIIVPQPNRWAWMGSIIKFSENKSRWTALADSGKGIITWSNKSPDSFASCAVVRRAPLMEDMHKGFSNSGSLLSFVISGMRG